MAKLFASEAAMEIALNAVITRQLIARNPI
jgi:hypothetical protein